MNDKVLSGVRKSLEGSQMLLGVAYELIKISNEQMKILAGDQYGVIGYPVNAEPCPFDQINAWWAWFISRKGTKFEQREMAQVPGLNFGFFAVRLYWKDPAQANPIVYWGVFRNLQRVANVKKGVLDACRQLMHATSGTERVPIEVIPPEKHFKAKLVQLHSRDLLGLGDRKAMGELVEEATQELVGWVEASKTEPR